MTDTLVPSETDESKPLENNATNQGTPPAVKTEDNEAEKLRKQLQQAEMERNQLRNKLEAGEKAKAEADAKKLEEQNEFKTLYEQEKARREAVETEAEQKERTEAIAKAQSEVLSGYSDEVRTLAEEAGMTLPDTDESSVEAFKAKIEKINGMVVKTTGVGANNPNRQSDKPTLTPDQLRQAMKDPDAFHNYVVERFPGIASMTKPQS
jgi:hypothetical protein